MSPIYYVTCSKLVDLDARFDFWTVRWFSRMVANINICICSMCSQLTFCSVRERFDWIWLDWWIWIQVHEISSFCSNVEVFAQKSTNLWWKTFDSWQQGKEILKSIKLWSFLSNFQGFLKNYKDFRDIEEICGEKCSNRGSRARGFRPDASRHLKRFLAILMMSGFWKLIFQW